MASNKNLHGGEKDEVAADALLLPKASGKDLLHRSSKTAGEEAQLQLPVTTKDVAVAEAGGPPPTVLEQAAAALFYAIASLIVIFVNKLVLTAMEFPSFFFIALSQFTSTCFVISVLRVLGYIKLAPFDRATAQATLPLMIMFLLNTVSGLGGTQRINLPMFTVLRRFSILMTMLMEKFILKSIVSPVVQISVALMIGGAVVAAFFDLQFELVGYLLILSNDFFTAAYGVCVKQALNLKIPQMSLLYFNSLFGAIAMTVVVRSMPGEWDRIVNFPEWRNSTFIALYLCTSFMGSVLQYSIFMCTQVNSALTTAVVGCLKNLLTTVVGMCGVGSDYEFGLLNCAGLAISMGGSFLYSWAKVLNR